MYRWIFVSLLNLTRSLRFRCFTVIAVLFVSLIGINNNAGATLILENQDQAEKLKQEVNTILNSISNITSDYNIIKNSLTKIFDILINKQATPGIYYEFSELPPLPTNQSITSQFDSELPPLPTKR